jgi:hypothetical protein
VVFPARGQLSRRITGCDTHATPPKEAENWPSCQIIVSHTRTIMLILSGVAFIGKIITIVFWMPPMVVLF